MRTPENMHDERTKYPQHAHARKQQDKARRTCLPGFCDHRRCRKQRNNDDDAEQDDERIRGDAAGILRLFSIQGDTRAFP